MALSDFVSKQCRLCGSEVLACGQQVLLRHYQVQYFQCPICALIQTETPTWLDVAYDKAISSFDTAAIQRNQITSWFSLALSRILRLTANMRCMDYGGGHGVFVRMMRDLGMDFRWYDRYAINLFARGFEAAINEQHDFVTLFEVFEHLDDVAKELERLFAPRHLFVLVSTQLHHGYRDGWWYFANDTGQHIAFFSERTMQFVGERFCYRAIVGPEYTLFVENSRPLGSIQQMLVQQMMKHPKLTYMLNSIVPYPVLVKMGPYRSRTQSDHVWLKDHAKFRVAKSEKLKKL
jgi:hypothetical protein